MSPADRVRSPVELVRERMTTGFLRVLGAESLGLPTGIVVVAVLARKLDTTEFGLFSLAFAIVSLAELLVVSLLARAANKAVSVTADWRPVGDAVLVLYTLVAGATCLILVLTAEIMARSMELPALGPALRLFALDLLPFGIARAHRDLLNGTGRFSERANAAATGLVVRMAATVVLVLISPSVSSAILGTIGGTLAEMAYCRHQVKPRFSGWRGLAALPMQAYLLPVFIATGAELALARIDVVFLKWLGTPGDQVGIYGAAQRLSLVPGLYAVAIAAPLLATLGLLVRDGERLAAAELGREALRFGLIVLPIVVLLAATATELAVLILGERYAAAGPILTLLIVAAFARVLVVVGNILLLGADRPRLAAWFAVAAVLAALVGYAVLIPRYGLTGAAATTLGASLFLAVTVCTGAMTAWQTRFPAATLGRSILVGTAGFALARLWTAEGGVVVLKLFLLVGLVPVGYSLLGEWSKRDLDVVRELWRGWWSRGEGAGEGS